MTASFTPLPEPPFFDIVVPFHGGGEWLATCLASISGQTAGLIRSVTVYDDASRDGTTPSKESLGRFSLVVKPQQTGAFESIKEFHRQLRSGQALLGRPPGVTVRVDGDDYLLPGALEKVMDEYAKPKTVATYGGLVVHPLGHATDPIRHGGIYLERWIFSALMTWHQDLWQLANEFYPECFGPYEGGDPGGHPASDVAYFLPMFKLALEHEWKVRLTYPPTYAWRSHEGNEQHRRRDEQIACERAVYLAIRKADAARGINFPSRFGAALSLPRTGL